MLGLVTFPHRYEGSSYLRIRIDRSSSPDLTIRSFPQRVDFRFDVGQDTDVVKCPGRRTGTSR
jgi:hypothetical protein